VSDSLNDPLYASQMGSISLPSSTSNIECRGSDAFIAAMMRDLGKQAPQQPPPPLESGGPGLRPNTDDLFDRRPLNVAPDAPQQSTTPPPPLAFPGDPADADMTPPRKRGRRPDQRATTVFGEEMQTFEDQLDEVRRLQPPSNPSADQLFAYSSAILQFFRNESDRSETTEQYVLRLLPNPDTEVRAARLMRNILTDFRKMGPEDANLYDTNAIIAEGNGLVLTLRQLRAILTNTQTSQFEERPEFGVAIVESESKASEEGYMANTPEYEARVVELMAAAGYPGWSRAPIFDDGVPSQQQPPSAEGSQQPQSQQSSSGAGRQRG
jgi:hypothetical protein